MAWASILAGMGTFNHIYRDFSLPQYICENLKLVTISLFFI